MAAKYEFDFSKFEVTTLIAKGDKYLVEIGKAMIAADPEKVSHVIKDMVQQYASKGKLSDGQVNYLASLVKFHAPEYKQYNEEMLAWYDSRPDIQEVYHYAMSQSYVYVVHPVSGQYVSEGGEGWDASWKTRPANANMFWRAVNDWNVKRFRVIKADSSFEEGDLVELRKPHIGDWRYDPFYDGSKTPPPTDIRLGTVMQMTEEVHNRSRAGKGSRLVNVLFLGKSEVTGVPERLIKLHERKRKKKSQ